KRLKAILPLWLPSYIKEFGTLSLEVVQSLRGISPATLDRLLEPTRVKYKGRGRTTTKPGTLLRKQIPIKTNQWDANRGVRPQHSTMRADPGDTIKFAEQVRFVF